MNQLGAFFVFAVLILWGVGAVWISILAILAIARTAAKRPWIRNRFVLVGLGWACALVAFLLACYFGLSHGSCEVGFIESAICTAIPDWLGNAIVVGALLGWGGDHSWTDFSGGLAHLRNRNSLQVGPQRLMGGASGGRDLRKSLSSKRSGF